MHAERQGFNARGYKMEMATHEIFMKVTNVTDIGTSRLLIAHCKSATHV